MCSRGRAKKVQAVLDFPTPTNCRQLQQFLGLAGYYRKFVPRFAHISSALSDLLKKGTGEYRYIRNFVLFCFVQLVELVVQLNTVFL